MTDPSPEFGNLAEYTVSEISAALKRTVEDAYGRVRVRGEISGFKRATSGHVYLALKDDKAVLDGVLWRGMAGRLGFDPEDGLEVVCEGRLTTYAGRSKYQLVIETMQPAGVGALLAMVEERRKKLAAEGLFDDSLKRPIPYLPEVVGVVTSPTGAVLRDILHRLRDRFPRPVLVWPVRVQGEDAAGEIAAAIAGFNALTQGGAIARPDVLIVARGGGSIEDLWAFNEEAVVRAAAASTIPLISAVGHETDTTLIDFASDRRAPTPSAAAEMVVPVRAELLVTLADRGRQLIAAATRMLADHRRSVDSLARGLPRPQAVLGEATQRLDDRIDRLAGARDRYFRDRQIRLAALRPMSPARTVAVLAHRLGAAGDGLERAIGRAATDHGRRLETAGKLLDSFSYRNVLARGYAVVRGESGDLIKSAAATKPGGAVRIEFADDTVPAVVGAGAKPAAPRKPRARAPRNEDQGQLI
ncbi:MAG: exodeoxyribonuclease VII large subunit [Alphaproteobacteria bacterium]|nr:exodeoxyribonuclease VII large subunit [Alphaproteobacteria bacterium]